MSILPDDLNINGKMYNLCQISHLIYILMNVITLPPNTFLLLNFFGLDVHIIAKHVGSKGDQLIVNHGLIASADLYKVNIWGLLLPAK